MAKNQATTQPKETKVAQARVIYDAVTAKGADLGGLTPRRAFMNRAEKELGMSNSGANTYFQNFKNEDEGKGRYAYSPASTAGKGTAAPTKAQVREAEMSVGEQMQALTTAVNRLNRTIAKRGLQQAAQ